MAEIVQIVVDETTEVVNIIVTDTAGPSVGQGDTLPIDDTRSIVKNAVDNSKAVRIDASAISPNTTRTIIMPDADVDLSQSGSGSTLPVTDDTSIVRNSVDGTKQVRINASNVSINSTRTIIVPDSDVDLSQVATALQPGASTSDLVNDSDFVNSQQVAQAIADSDLGDSLPVTDDTSIVISSFDPTKQVRINAGSIAPNTTRTIIVPDNDVDLSQVLTAANAGTASIIDGSGFNGNVPITTQSTQDLAQVVDNLDLGGGGGVTLPVNDTTSLVQDPIDATKQVRINAGGISTGNVRSIIMPDNDVDLSQVLTVSNAGTSTTIDATGFDGNLPNTTESIQQLAQVVDDLNLGGGGVSDQDIFLPISEGGNNGFGTFFRDLFQQRYLDIGDGAVDITFSNDGIVLRGISGTRSVGFGVNIIETGSDNTVSGGSVELSGDRDVFIGREADITGNDNLIIGDDIVVNSNESVILSNQATITRDRVVAIGFSSDPGAEGSIAIGHASKTFSFSEISIGSLFGTEYLGESTLNFQPTDRLVNFPVGVDEFNRKDAFTILKNTKTGIGYDNFEDTTEAAILQVNGTAHSSASVEDIEQGTEGTLVTKAFLASQDTAPQFSSDAGTTGLVLTTDQDNEFTVGGQKWEWARSGNSVTFSAKVNSVSGGTKVGRMEMDFSATTIPFPSLSSRLQDHSFSVLANLDAPTFSTVEATFSLNRLRFLIGSDGQNNTSSITDATMNGGRNMTVSGSFRTTDKIGVIMAGGPNMSGRDTPQGSDLVSDPKVFFTNNTPSPQATPLAVEPTHEQYETSAGVSPGLSFGKRVSPELASNQELLLIPTAVGGVSLDNWINDDTVRGVQLLTNFTEKVNRAQNLGVEIQAIMWHQGTPEAQVPSEITTYAAKEAQLFAIFRTIVGDPNLLIISGELKSLGGFSEAEAEAINAQKESNVASDGNAFLTDSSDFSGINGFNYDRASNVIMGQRMADVFIAERLNQ